MILHVKCNFKKTAPEKLEDRPVTLGVTFQKETALRNDTLAGQERRDNIGQLRLGPLVVPVSPAKTGNQGASIQDHTRLHLPKP